MRTVFASLVAHRGVRLHAAGGRQKERAEVQGSGEAGDPLLCLVLFVLLVKERKAGKVCWVAVTYCSQGPILLSSSFLSVSAVT